MKNINAGVNIDKITISIKTVIFVWVKNGSKCPPLFKIILNLARPMLT